MNSTKLAICTLVATVYIFILDYVFYGILMSDFFMECCMRDGMPDMLWLVIGTLVMAFMFCMMYPKGVEGSNKTQQGLRYGIMIAILIFVSVNFIMYGVNDPAQCGELTTYLVDMIWRIVQFAVLGVIVAHVSGVTAKEGRGKDDPKPITPPDSGQGQSGQSGGN